MRLTSCLPVVFIMSSLVANAQHADSIHYNYEQRSIQVVTGFTFGKNRFAEIGVAKNIVGVVGRVPYTLSMYVTSEMKINGNFMLGPKIGAYYGNGGIAMAGNFIYYTDFDNATLVFRPEIGFGFSVFKFVYGYNCKLTKDKLDRLDQSVGSLFIGIPVKKLKDRKVIH